MNLRIGVVQFSPKIGQVQANLVKARELCKKLIQPRTLDILCFPEMVLSGYVFANATAILPYLEHPRTGVTSLFCSEIAKKLQCHVFAGYPEASKPAERDTSETSKGVPNVIPDGDRFAGVGANSAILYGPEGEWIGGYRKTNLFETDKTWAKAGTGFAVFRLPPPIRTVCLGICMDLNPQTLDWQWEDGPYELASHCLSNKANLLILLNAWLDSKEEPEEEHDWHTLNYWAGRLRPLWTDKNSEAAAGERPSTRQDGDQCGKETAVVICNRNGEENGRTFAGTSAIFSMVQGSGRPRLLDMMGRHEEGVQIWQIPI